MDEEGLKPLLAVADLVVVRRYYRITKNMIDAAKRLKLIQCARTVVDTIDVDAAKEAGIPVANMTMAIDSRVAEHAMALILALIGNLMKLHRSVVNGEYRKMGLKPIKTTEYLIVEHWAEVPVKGVFGKALGIIGLGDIGREVAKRARSFGMKILYYKRHRMTESEEKELGVQYRSLNELLKEADFVSLHVPLTEETEKMIGQRELSLMKPTAFLINMARGGVVDQAALYRALKNRVIAGAGLDVFEEEPLPWDSPLIKLDNVILTPHAAAAMEETSPFDLQRIKENLYRVMKGEKPLNIVNNL